VSGLQIGGFYGHHARINAGILVPMAVGLYPSTLMDASKSWETLYERLSADPDFQAGVRLRPGPLRGPPFHRLYLAERLDGKQWVVHRSNLHERI